MVLAQNMMKNEEKKSNNLNFVKNELCLDCCKMADRMWGGVPFTIPRFTTVFECQRSHCFKLQIIFQLDCHEIPQRRCQSQGEKRKSNFIKEKTVCCFYVFKANVGNL